MTLKNTQYETIMREYSRRQSENRRVLDDRRDEVFERFPRIRQIQEEIARSGADAVRAALSASTFAASGAAAGFHGSAGDPDLKSRIKALETEQQAILVKNGYPADYLKLPHTCPLCGDTGYVDGRKCTCFKKAEMDLFYSQPSLKNILQFENFDHFSFDWYSDRIKNEATGLTAKETARAAYDTAKRFVRDFDKKDDNLFIYGDTGVGKTFLSHCIAHDLLASSHSVFYFTAYDFFRLLADRTFSQPGSTDTGNEDLLECDLLILDDLGTEVTNSFVSSQLFLVLNERLLSQRSTIISTNLPLQDFSDTYSERTMSRIASSYTMLKLTGQDIRIQKKLSGGTANVRKF